MEHRLLRKVRGRIPHPNESESLEQLQHQLATVSERLSFVRAKILHCFNQFASADFGEKKKINRTIDVYDAEAETLNRHRAELHGLIDNLVNRRFKKN